MKMSEIIKFFTNLLSASRRILKHVLTETIHNYGKHQNKPTIQWNESNPIKSIRDVSIQNSECLNVHQDTFLITFAKNPNESNGFYNDISTYLKQIESNSRPQYIDLGGFIRNNNKKQETDYRTLILTGERNKTGKTTDLNSSVEFLNEISTYLKQIASNSDQQHEPIFDLNYGFIRNNNNKNQEQVLESNVRMIEFLMINEEAIETKRTDLLKSEIENKPSDSHKEKVRADEEMCQTKQDVADRRKLLEINEKHFEKCEKEINSTLPILTKFSHKEDQKIIQNTSADTVEECNSSKSRGQRNYETLNAQISDNKKEFVAEATVDMENEQNAASKVNQVLSINDLMKTIRKQVGHQFKEISQKKSTTSRIQIEIVSTRKCQIEIENSYDDGEKQFGITNSQKLSEIEQKSTGKFVKIEKPPEEQIELLETNQTIFDDLEEDNVVNSKPIESKLPILYDLAKNSSALVKINDLESIPLLVQNDEMWQSQQDFNDNRELLEINEKCEKEINSEIQILPEINDREENRNVQTTGTEKQIKLEVENRKIPDDLDNNLKKSTLSVLNNLPRGSSSLVNTNNFKLSSSLLDRENWIKSVKEQKIKAAVQKIQNSL